MLNLSLVFQIFALLNPIVSFPFLIAAHKRKISKHSFKNSWTFLMAVAEEMVTKGIQMMITTIL